MSGGQAEVRVQPPLTCNSKRVAFQPEGGNRSLELDWEGGPGAPADCRRPCASLYRLGSNRSRTPHQHGRIRSRRPTSWCTQTLPRRGRRPRSLRHNRRLAQTTPKSPAFCRAPHSDPRGLWPAPRVHWRALPALPIELGRERRRLRSHKLCRSGGKARLALHAVITVRTLPKADASPCLLSVHHELD